MKKTGTHFRMKAVNTNKIAGLAILVFFVTCTGMMVAAFAEGKVTTSVTYDAGDRRDPFKPLITAAGFVTRDVKAASSDLFIEGIIYDPYGTSMVIISGEVYEPGDTVQDAVVVKILQNRVIFWQGDEEKEIWLREETLEEAGNQHDA